MHSASVFIYEQFAVRFYFFFQTTLATKWFEFLSVLRYGHNISLLRYYPLYAGPVLLYGLDWSIVFSLQHKKYSLQAVAWYDTRSGWSGTNERTCPQSAYNPCLYTLHCLSSFTDGRHLDMTVMKMNGERLYALVD